MFTNGMTKHETVLYNLYVNGYITFNQMMSDDVQAVKKAQAILKAKRLARMNNKKKAV